MKFVLLYGWEGSPKKNWFPWLERELKDLGYKVVVPELPGSYNPILKDWLKTLNNLLEKEAEPVVLVGHSLGGVLILHYLEQQRKMPLVKLAVFAASWGEDDGLLEPEIVNFFPRPFNYLKIRKSAKKFVSLSGDNDPLVGKKFSQNLADYLGIKPVWVKSGGHLSEEFGFKKFPQLLGIIKRELEG